MRAAFDDASLFQNHDAVGVAHGGQPVRDDKGRASRHQRVHTVLHQFFRSRVDGRSRLVENQHRRIGHGRAGNGEQLPLSLAQIRAVAGQNGRVAVRQAPNEAVCVGQLCGGNAFVIGGGEVSVTDIFQDAAAEQVRILQNHSQRTPQIRLFDLVDVDAVIADLAIRNVIKTVDEVGDGRLSGPGRADKRDLLARLCPHADVMQHNFIRVVSEIHAVKDDPAFQFGIGNGAVGLVRMFPGPQIRALRGFRQFAFGRFLDIDQFDIARVRLRFLIHQIEHALRPGRGRDHEVDLHTHLGDGLGEILIEANKGHHRAQRHTGQAVDSHYRPSNGHQRIAQPADIRVDRHQQVGVAIGLIRAFPKGLVYLVKILLRRLFVAKDLDDFLPIQHFLNESVYNAQVLLLLDIILSGKPGKAGCDD